MYYDSEEVRDQVRIDVMRFALGGVTIGARTGTKSRRSTRRWPLLASSTRRRHNEP